MKTIQEIFDVAIANDFEKKVKSVVGKDMYFPAMCWSISKAARDGLLTLEELKVAVHAIGTYLSELSEDSSGYLGKHLSDVGLPYSPLDRLAIYRDWANRPTLKH